MKLRSFTIDEKDNMSSDIEFLEELMKINEEIHSNPSQDRLQELNQANDGMLQVYIYNIYIYIYLIVLLLSLQYTLLL